ncbi:retron Se72 family effector protein [Pseudomonas sp. D2002]|uniref:retron Se72 family effector protein n=1 Tax=Pseudomonas sp. D2002 TaxID=2726980 RepID=UPI003526E25B
MEHKKNPIHGIVTTFDPFKGYGFIRRAEGKDVFFYYDDICDEDKNLTKGDKVEFILEIEKKGPKAYAVKKIGEAY